MKLARVYVVNIVKMTRKAHLFYKGDEDCIESICGQSLPRSQWITSDLKPHKIFKVCKHCKKRKNRRCDEDLARLAQFRAVYQNAQ